MSGEVPELDWRDATSPHSSAGADPSIEWQWRAPLLRSVGALALSFLVGLMAAQILSRSGDWLQGLPWERALLLGLDRSMPRLLDDVMLLLPWLGTNLTVMPLVCIASAWLWKRRRRPELAVRLLTVTTGSLLLNALLKALYDRPRPALWEHRGQYKWGAFPSGHAIVTTSVLFTIAILLHRERGWRWPYGVASLILVVSLYSRLYLGVHWPTDVVAGIAIGLTWLAGTIWAFRPPSRAVGYPPPEPSR